MGANILGMGMLKRRPAGSIAVGAVLAAVVAAVLILLWPEGNGPGPAGPTSADPATPPEASPFPPPSVAVVEPSRAVPPDDDPVPAVEEGRPALCDGCLTERAVLDVVDTYLRHLDPVYLHGEIWAHPLTDVAPETPGSVDGLPKLPPGLLDAPEFNPMGKSIDTRRYPVETTWVVWIQTGWRSPQAIEQQIVLGKLPEVALSWPPIKEETFVAVDGRTGEISPDGIFRLTSQGVWPRPPAHYDAVLEATRARTARWLRGGGQRLGSP